MPLDVLFALNILSRGPTLACEASKRDASPGKNTYSSGVLLVLLEISSETGTCKHEWNYVLRCSRLAHVRSSALVLSSGSSRFASLDHHRVYIFPGPELGQGCLVR